MKHKISLTVILLASSLVQAGWQDNILDTGKVVTVSTQGAMAVPFAAGACFAGKSLIEGSLGSTQEKALVGIFAFSLAAMSYGVSRSADNLSDSLSTPERKSFARACKNGGLVFGAAATALYAGYALDTMPTTIESIVVPQ